MAKAGLVAALPARASLLAAANPAGGHYNRAKSLAENVKMISGPMLSRWVPVRQRMRDCTRTHRVCNKWARMLGWQVLMLPRPG